MSVENIVTEITPLGPLGTISPPGVQTIVVTLVTTGLTGAPGTNSGGGPGAPSYLHSQPVAAATWNVNHNLGYRPAVTVLSVGGMAMLADVQHVSVNQAVVYFDQPTSGQAACS